MNKRQVTNDALTTGVILGDYRIERIIGQGDNSQVWFAANMNDGTMAALKVMISNSASRCYTNSCCVEHPNIVRPTAMFNDDGKGILVMPPCMGRSVEGLAGYVSEQQAWQLLTDMASALTALHSAGMAHGNVCAENILWDGGRFLLTGFSNSRAVSDGGRPADDVWQLGATIFYLCMGCHVFNGMGMKAQRPTSPLPYMRKSMPQLSETVQRCLAYSGRPSAGELLAMAEKGQKAYTGGGRQYKIVASNPRRLKNDFWPDAMRRVVMVMAFSLCWLALPAQNFSDKELSDLVKIVVDLRDNYSDKTYDKVRSLLLKDEKWTQMCELEEGSPKEGECAPSDPVDCSYLNSILTDVDDLRKKPVTHGDALNGEDPRYYYSLYECYIKAGATVEYTLNGREGAQTFVIVPFAGNKSGVAATITIQKESVYFVKDTTYGLLVANYNTGQLTKDTPLTLTVRNTSAQSQAFVIINHNTRQQ